MALSLNVQVEGSAGVRTMRFMQDVVVRDVCQQLAKTEKLPAGTFGLFQIGAAGINHNGRWLRMDKTLQFYDLVNGVRRMFLSARVWHVLDQASCC